MITKERRNAGLQELGGREEEGMELYYLLHSSFLS
jgi:hypothetical protein